MKKRTFIIALLLGILLLSCGCTTLKDSSSFSIHFIDVGEGDSALVECGGHFMLIDGGDTYAGETVRSVLQEKGVQHLDILAISHLHQDHIGGLPKVLGYTQKIDRIISNSTYSNIEAFRKLESELGTNGAKIRVPKPGDKYDLGSAKIEVIDVASEADNDSLVLLITYGRTRFLFTGDIEEEAQRRIVSKYENESNSQFKVDLIKMPHHGAKVLIRFIDILTPDYAVISTGGKQYRHPYSETMDMLKQADVRTYRTDMDGDIVVDSDGTNIRITTSK